MGDQLQRVPLARQISDFPQKTATNVFGLVIWLVIAW